MTDLRAIHEVLYSEGADDVIAIFAATDETVTRRALRSRVETVAAGMAALGVERGDRIAVMLPNCLEYLEVVFAASVLGAVVVHLHTAIRGQMLERPLRLTKPRCVVVSADALSRFVAAGLGNETAVLAVGGTADPGLLGSRVGGAYAELIRRESELAAHNVPEAGPRAPICIYSSSGTTGPAKGVTMSHSALFEMAHTAQLVMGYRDSDVAYAITPFYHANALVFMFLAATRAGARTVFADRFSVSRFWDDVDRYGATKCSLVGSAAALLMTQPEGRNDASTTLELIASVPRLPDAQAFERRFGVRLTEFYGSTEANLPIGIPYGESRDRSCGRSLPGWECKIVDVDDREVPAGTDGQLLVRSTAHGVVSSGYWGEPERTVELWQDLWIHTGDLMRRDIEGWFYFVDRLKDAIRVSGENVASADVEAVIRSFVGVQEAAAFGIPSELGDQDIAVAMILADDELLDCDALRQHCFANLPYFAVPRYYEVVDVLPRTPTERIRKVELRERGVTDATIDLGRPRRADVSAAG